MDKREIRIQKSELMRHLANRTVTLSSASHYCRDVEKALKNYKVKHPFLCTKSAWIGLTTKELYEFFRPIKHCEKIFLQYAGRRIEAIDDVDKELVILTRTVLTVVMHRDEGNFFLAE